jgi:CHAT domain-containing protein
VEGLLAGGFPHVPYVPVARPPAPPDDVRGNSVQVPRDEASAALFADNGVEALLKGNPDTAVFLLEAAVRGEPDDPRHWSDLAAAYLERAAAGQDTHDDIRALSAARRAVTLAPDLPEALFNQALALERLGLREEAIKAWDAYRSLGTPDSGWAGEADARRQALAAPTPAELWRGASRDLERAAALGDAVAVRRLVVRFPQQARERAEETFLPEWAGAYREGRAGDAARWLAAARTVGAALAARGEHMAADAVAAIDAALTTPADPARATALAEGHLGAREGRALQRSGAPIAAQRVLRTAGARLRDGSSPFAAWTDLYLAICDYQLSDYQGALRILTELWSDPEAARSSSLRGHIAWMAGLARFRGSDPSAALAEYDRALALFDRLGEAENIGAIQNFIAEALDYLGEDREAWRHRGLALASLSASPNPKRRQAILEEVERAVAPEEPEIALLFRESAVRAARSLGEPVALTYALFRRAVLRLRTGDEAGAAADLAEARPLVKALPEARQVMEAEIALAEGEMVLQRDPREAAQLLGEALTYFKTDGVRMLEVSLLRSRAHREAGDEVLADADLASGIAEAERQRDKVIDEAQRVAYFDRMQPLFDQRIASALRRGETGAALDLAEQARARTLLDRLNAGGADSGRGPLASAALPDLIPPGVAVVEYAALDDRLCIWILRHDRRETVTVALPAARLALWVGNLRSALAGGIDERGFRRFSRKLHDAVVGPALAGSPPGETLVFIPDKALHDLPFAALLDSASGRFLIEDHPVGVAPSASLWVRALERDRRLAARPVAGALLVGDPAFDEASFPGLQRLQDAHREVESLARLYPPGRTLTLLGSEATRPRVLGELGRYGVVQISGHSQINPEEPRRSRLALAASPGDSGVLYARDLEGLRLEGPRLVVLAACSTGLRETAGAEGTSGLTRAFLAAGIPAVAASLWDVRDSPATGQLMIALHQHLLAGESPLAALRSAQLSLLSAPDPALRDPRIWAAFQVFGSAVTPTLPKR